FENLEPFRAAFAAEVAARADPATIDGVIHSDGAIAAADLSIATARALADGGPWGQGFPEPVFDGEFDVCDARVVGERHLKLRLSPAGDAAADSVDAIAFGFVDGTAAGAPPPSGARVTAAFRLEVNEFNGRTRLQLNCQHLRRL
ncbi:MAG: single-stranded-DNA-specific exonuclease RecJ, partial [Gammaproteobacteria bacterium]|nr:single-stranded-DNA-specific exonuclease RecJ [Gammaproteobacteria bacterium]